LVSQAFGSTNTLVITNGQIYNVGDAYRLNTSVSSGSAGRAGLVIDGGTLNLGDTVGSGTGQLRFNHGDNAGNVSYVDLNSNGVIRAEAITRMNAGNDAAINWNDGTIGNYAGTDLLISATAGTMKLVLAGTGTHTFEAESGRTITVASTALLEDKAGEAGTLNKTGAGTLRINSASTYTGATTISAGSLVLGNTGSVAGSSVLDVASGATLDVSLVTGGFVLGSAQTLGGNGTIVGDTSISGTLAPGNSAGTLTFNNNLTLGSSSTSIFEINGFTTGLYDLVAGGPGSQTVNFDGTLSLVFAGDFSTLGSVRIFDFENYSGDFSSLVSTGLAAGYTASFDSSTGFVTVVPEPSTYALLALSAASLGAHVFARRRRR
jgi:autotransporter-associated beta strand protein